MSEMKAFQSNIHYYSPRLLKKLECIITAQVTVVEAPSGFGKTTAVRDYLMDKLPKDIPVYWWSADEDAWGIFWTRLCRELEHIDPAAGKELLFAGLPRLMSAWEIGQVISSLRCDTQSVLVLDDFHILQKELPRSVMSALLSYTGTKLHLIIITQKVRPFPLPFFEQANVHYIRADDLRLNTEDVRRYCRLCGVAVSETEAGQLYGYTGAGAWYARTGETINALSCFFKIKDYEAILSLPLTGLTMALIDGLPFTQLAAGLLADCPIGIKRKYPILLLRIAYAFIGAGKEEIKNIIGEVEDKNQRNALLGEWTMVSSYLAFPNIIKMEPIFQEAEMLSYPAAYLAEGSGQWTVRIGTVNLMAQLAVKRGSNNDLSQYVKKLEETVGNDFICPLVMQMLQTDYYMWLGLTELIPK